MVYFILSTFLIEITTQRNNTKKVIAVMTQHLVFLYFRPNKANL